MLWNQKVTSVLDVDKFDLDDWQKIGQSIPKLLRADDSAAQEFSGRPVQDAFFSLKSAAPKFADPTPTGLRPLAELLKRGMETPAWTNLHETSVGDNVAAGIAAHAFVTETLKSLPQDIKDNAKEAEQAQAKADELNRQAENLLETAEMLAQMGQQEKADELTKQAEELAEQAQDFDNAADAMAQAAMMGIEENGAKIAAIANNAAMKANGQAQEASALVKSFTLAAGGDPSHVDPGVAGAAMRILQNNKNLKDLAEMLGWAKRVVRAEWRKSPKAKTTLTGYKAHDLQPSSMAAGEYQAMVSDNEALHLDWMRRASESAVMHRQYSGDEQSGRGELILVRDESGSMSGANHSLAVALEWALLEIARRDKREFVSIPFSGAGQFKTWRAPKPGKGDVAGLEAHLSHFYGGGTEPYAPMAQALSEIADNDLRADILLITDGDFAEPPADFLAKIKAERSKRPLKVVAVVIGGSYGEHRAKQFSDKVINLVNFTRDREKIREAIADVI